MANNTVLNPGALGDTIATKDVAGVKHELVINEFSDGAGGVTEVSASDPLPVTDNAAELSLASIDLKLTSPTTVFNGKTLVTVAGTRVVLAASTVVKTVTVKALVGNIGLIYVGNATVSSANGFQLSAGDSVNLDIADLNTINIDSDNSGMGVSYMATV